jgi:hypothetical protein
VQGPEFKPLYLYVKMKRKAMSPVANFCNPSCLGGRIRKIMVQGQPRQKCKILSVKIKVKTKGLET